jgi:MraZ protein
MMRFWGNMEAKADVKGRVFLTCRIQEATAICFRREAYMRKDVFQDCLVLYPESVWNKELDELRAHLNKWDSKHQLIFRQFVSDVELVMSSTATAGLLIPRALFANFKDS